MMHGTEAVGMKVISSKTLIVCFSDATGYKPDNFIKDSDGNRIHCDDSLKALGMRFSSKPDMSTHVTWLTKNMRERFWTLISLKKSGFTEKELTYVH